VNRATRLGFAFDGRGLAEATCDAMSAAAKVDIRLNVGMMSCGWLESKDVCKCCCAKGMLDGCDVELKASWDALYTESTTALVALQQEHIEIIDAWNGNVSSHNQSLCSILTWRVGQRSHLPRHSLAAYGAASQVSE
jgi:hypothetical protein